MHDPVNALYQMGFGATRVDSALQRCNGDVPEATELLLSESLL